VPPLHLRLQPSGGSDEVRRLLGRAQAERECRRASKKKHQSGGAIYRQRADTNMVAVKLHTVGTEAAPLATGDPCRCKSCNAIFNSFSKLSTVNGASTGAGASSVDAAAGDDQIDCGDQQVWTCEFCGTPNEVDLDQAEIPVASTVDYILAPPHPKASAASDSGATPACIFVVDVSGSMCVTTAVPGGGLSLKGAAERRKAAQDMAGEFGDGSYQFLRGESRNTTYVSRLQAVQAAVDSQLAELHPDTPVGIITFSDSVTVYGDCSKSTQPIVLRGDSLSDLASITRAGESASLTATIKDCRTEVTDTIWKLEEGGPTALGPALAAGIAMAKQVSGSKIVVCTDGLANVGLGSLESTVQADIDNTESFYSALGDSAKMSGVTVNVISIIGDEAKLEYLGMVGEATGGVIDRLDVTNLSSQFNAILAKPVQATNVTIQLHLHAALKFRDASDGSFPSDSSSAAAKSRTNVISKDVGNVNADSEEFFEFEVRDAAERSDLGLPAGSSNERLPFQLRITYTRLDGMQCVRVVTAVKEASKDKTKVESQVNFRVLAAGAAQQGARLASGGDYMHSRVSNHGYRNTMERCLAQHKSVSSPANLSAYQTWVRSVGEMDGSVQQMQQNESLAGIDEGEEVMAQSGVFAKSASRKKVSKAASARRKCARSDSQAVKLMSMKRCNTDMFSGGADEEE